MVGADPDLDVVYLFVEQGGHELLLKQDNDGGTALEVVFDKGGEVHKYLIDVWVWDYQLYLHCSTSFVTVFTIQQYITKHRTDCLFQTNTHDKHETIV